ncbi:GTPase effector domain, GED [Beauveria brongniartii RCEF 3172]|uniref:GTPase effector domain, GED n=1 Tax=Beauveria brongniartii RCEF 3172 TaxID=1081107 RepID=A0A166YAT7_9HYPO|nr:GTPase effector domain, GED [Beauveria brongniartii RCEF 3172]
MDHFSACEALDFLDAYYKVALKRFIDDVAVEVIETCLLNKLSVIMDPSSIFMMSEAEVADIAAETEESQAAREELKTKLKILKGGDETCKKFAALYFNVLDNAVSDTNNTADRSSNTGNETPATDPMAANHSDEESGCEIAPEATLSENQVLEEPIAEPAPEQMPSPFVDDEWPIKMESKKKSKKASLMWNETAPTTKPVDDTEVADYDQWTSTSRPRYRPVR